MIAKRLDLLQEGNPQLLREVKGRLTPRNLAIATALSIVGQILVYLYYRSLLPSAAGFNRYCTAEPPENLYQNSYYLGNTYCLQDLNGQWMVLERLWWLDIFTFLSIGGIFALLVVGTYQLIADIVAEERQGTLNFIRLSPQSAKTIFIGKMLGVPILLYWILVLALPFHCLAGLGAGIPIGLILAFYGVLIASCVFFYCAGLVFALASHWLIGFQAWLFSGAILVFLLYSTLIAMADYGGYQTPFDWLTLFYPGFVLPYLVKSTFLPPDAVGYLGSRQLSHVLWYGQPLWRSMVAGVVFILLNYGLWTYWLTKALKRRFHNPLVTLIGKSRSYWITAGFCAIGLGFVFQVATTRELFLNFGILTAFLAIFCFLLVIALTPQRQALQDWMRYRHQNDEKQVSFLKALVWSDKSPSTLAIALNLGIASVFFVPAILVSPLEAYRLATLGGFLLGANMMLLYASIVQFLLLWKTNKRSLLAGGAIAFLVTFPILCFGVLAISPSEAPLLWSFTALPMIASQYATGPSIGLALLGQWLSLTLIGRQIQRQLRQVGASTTQALLSGAK